MSNEHHEQDNEEIDFKAIALERMGNSIIMRIEQSFPTVRMVYSPFPTGIVFWFASYSYGYDISFAANGFRILCETIDENVPYTGSFPSQNFHRDHELINWLIRDIGRRLPS